MRDLHIHSIHSEDGEIPVAEIIRECADRELRQVAISDHNTIAGVGEAVEAGNQYGVQVLPAVELDCHFGTTDLHLLGYNINYLSSDFQELNHKVSQAVMDAYPVMIENLEKNGIPVDEDEVLQKAGDKLPCAETIAEVLFTNPEYHHNELIHPYLPGGARSDMPNINFYLDYFAQGKPAYVKIDTISFEEAVDLVTRNNGTAIVAHPGANLRGREDMIRELLEAGAGGFELFNNYHDRQQIDLLGKIGLEADCIMTCGSDFHGRNKPKIRLGEYKQVDSFSPHVAQSVEALAETGLYHSNL